MTGLTVQLIVLKLLVCTAECLCDWCVADVAAALTLLALERPSSVEHFSASRMEGCVTNMRVVRAMFDICRQLFASEWSSQASEQSF